MQQLFSGIDLGTSGCRIIVIDQHKSVKYESQVRYDDEQAQSPKLWWSSVKSLLLSLPLEIKSALKALSVDGTSGTLLLTDSNGKPVSSTLMYHDMRATQEADLIKKILPKDSGAQGVASSLARLLWLQKHEANAMSCASHALHQADYILGKLSHTFGLSDENNCLKLGYDALHRCWPDQMAQFNFPLSLLPKVHPAGTALQCVAVSVADELGLPRDLQLVAGTTDSIAAFIASGANQVGDAVTSLGSTLVVKLISDKPIFAPEYGVYSHRLGDHWLVGGASNSGAKVLLDYFSTDQLDQMTPLLNPQKLLGLDYYPLLGQGERFPFADAQKQPKLSPRPESDVLFFQAILEGIANIEMVAYQRLIELGVPQLKSVRSVGGGSKNKAWTQIRKNYLTLDMITPKQTEAAYGSALLAYKAINTIK